MQKLPNGGAVKHLFFINSFAILAALTARADMDLKAVDLQSSMVSYQFDSSKAGPLEKDLETMSAAVALKCTGESHQPYCIWSQVYAEFQAAGKLLAAESFDPTQLALTLGARLHPLNFVSYYKNGTGFDANYSRFLVAQRLLIELWPLIPSALKPVNDRFLLASLTARTAASFLLNISRMNSCTKNGLECYNKKVAIAVLQKVIEVIEEDKYLDQQLTATIEASKSKTEANRKNEIYKKLLNSLSGDNSGNLILFSTSTSYSPLDLTSAMSYLKNVEAQSTIPVTAIGNYTGRICEDLHLTLTTAKQQNIAWATLVSGEFICDESNGAVYSISGEALDQLQNNGLVWNFNQYQIRSMIKYLFSAMNSITAEELELVQLHEALADFQYVREQIRKFPKQELSEEDRHALKPHMAFIYKSILSQMDRASALLGEMK